MEEFTEAAMSQLQDRNIIDFGKIIVTAWNVEIRGQTAVPWAKFSGDLESVSEVPEQQCKGRAVTHSVK